MTMEGQSLGVEHGPYAILSGINPKRNLKHDEAISSVTARGCVGKKRIAMTG